MYASQLKVEKRFQEPQTLEKWAAGERITPLVDLSNIDRVPVSMVLAVNDSTCDLPTAEMAYSQITVEEKYLRYEQGAHITFEYKTNPQFLTRMLETIETGTVVDSAAKTALFVAGMATALLAAVF